MALGFFKRRKILKEANYLDLTPVRLFEHGESEDGKFFIIIPKFKTEAATKFFVPGRRSKVIKINLDEFGKTAWLEIDGVKPVHRIVSDLHEKFGEKIEPAETRVTAFLTMLYDREYITFKEVNDALPT